MVGLYPYATFETLCSLCLKVEAQVKSIYRSGSSSGVVKPKMNANEKAVTTPGSAVASSSTAIPKESTANKEFSLSKVHCFKFQGFEHYQSACPNRRIVTSREVVKACDEFLEKEERLSGTLVFDDPNETKEEEETYEPPNYDTALVLRTLKTQAE